MPTGHHQQRHLTARTCVCPVNSPTANLLPSADCLPSPWVHLSVGSMHSRNWGVSTHGSGACYLKSPGLGQDILTSAWADLAWHLAHQFPFFPFPTCLGALKGRDKSDFSWKLHDFPQA